VVEPMAGFDPHESSCLAAPVGPGWSGQAGQARLVLAPAGRAKPVRPG